MTTIEDYYNWKKSNESSSPNPMDDYYQWKTDVLDKAVAVEEKPPILSPEDEIRQQARESLFGSPPSPRAEMPKSSLWQKTKRAWELGGQSVNVDFMWSKVARGEISEAQAQEVENEFVRLLSQDPLKARNWLENLYLKTVQIARPMAGGTLKGMKYGTAGATGAAVVGQAGPQALLPEEIVTAPSAFTIGQTVGSVKYWAEQGQGSIYREARKQGLSVEASKAASAVGGPLYAFIEYSQVDKIIPGMGKLKGKILQKALQVGINTAKEIGEEGAQKIVTDGAVTIGKLVENKIDISDVPEEAKQIAKNALNEMKEAAGPMAILQIPGASVGIAETVAEQQKAKQAAKSKQTQYKEPTIREIAAGQAEMSEEEMLEVIRQEKIPETPVETRTEEEVAVTPTPEEIKQQREKPPEAAKEATTEKQPLSPEDALYDVGQAQAKLSEAIKQYGYGGITEKEQHPSLVEARKEKFQAMNELYNSLQPENKIGDIVTYQSYTPSGVYKVARKMPDGTFKETPNVEKIGQPQKIQITQAHFDVSQSADVLKKTGLPTTFAFHNLEGIDTSTGEKIKIYPSDLINKKHLGSTIKINPTEVLKNVVKQQKGISQKRIYQPKAKTLTSKEALEKPKAEKPKKKGRGKAIGDVASGGGIDTGRIKVEMERPSKKPQTAAEIINYMERAFDIPIRGKATFKKKYAAGWFDPKAIGIRMKDVRSLTTGMHEIGHHIDWTLNNRLSKNPPNKEMRKELMKLGKDLYGQTKPPGGYKSEGWAEFMREYLTGEKAKEKAPAVYKWFTEEYLPKHKDVKAKLAKIKGMITEWRMQGAEARIESQISKKDFKGGLIERFERAALWLDKKWRDELAPIRFSMAKAGIEQEQLAPGENPYQIAVARADKAGAVASHFVLEYTTDLAGNRTGKGLREILAPVAKDIDKFTRWIVSARARYLHRKGINPGISLADANYVYRQYDSSKWQTVLKEVTEWNHRLLDYLAEAGGLDKEAKKRIIESNPIYIPFMRAFKQGEIRFSGKGTGKGIAKTSKAIKKIKGSGREIIDPIESMINQAYKIISISHKTQVAKSLAMLAEKKGTASMIWRVPAPTQATQFEAEQLKKDIIRIAHEKMGVDPSEISSSMLEHWDELLTVYSNASHYYGKDNIVSLVIDGKRRFYEVDPMLYRAIEGLDQYTLPWAFLAKPARTVRLGATGLNPSFGLIRNFLRDALTFTVLSKHAKAGPVSAAKGVMEDISKTSGAQKFKALGGKMSSQILADRRALQHLKSHVLTSNLKGKTVYHVSHPIDALRELFGVTEAGTRIGEFIPALKSAEKKYGEGSIDAAIYALNQAQDVTTNFSRHGEIGKVLNQMIPFFNAAIQGPDKIVRTFRARPTETTLKAIAALTVPAIWLWWRHKDDEWYKNMAIWERINYLHFQIPDTDTIIRIPVPFELGHIFQSAPVAFLDSWDKEDPKLVKEMFEESVRQANPFDWPAVISPVVDILANEDFAGRPIVPMGAEYKLPKDQYKKYTTEMMKIIGETINYSPAKIEHLVNSYSGGLYLRVAKTIDLKNKKDITFKDMPVLTTLFLRDSFAPKAQINRFYERRDYLNQKYSSDKTSLSPEEKRQRKKYNSASTKLKDYWKDLNSADSEYDRAKVYEKMKRELKKAGALGKK